MTNSFELLANLLNLKGALLAALVFIPLQHALPLHAKQKIFRKGWRNDLIYLFLNGILIRIGLGVVALLALVAGESIIPQAFKYLVASQMLWVQVIELILLSDLGFYSMHRLFHAVPFLWRFHAVHHSIEELDWLAAHRVHPVDQILTKGVSLIPCFALGFSEWAIGASAILYHWHSLLLHANVRVKFGPLRWLIASPEFHHWHHSNQPEAWDKNFSAQLPLWDVLLRTAYMPENRIPSFYGINEPVPTTYIQQIVYPLSKPRENFRGKAGEREEKGSNPSDDSRFLQDSGKS